MIGMAGVLRSPVPRLLACFSPRNKSVCTDLLLACNLRGNTQSAVFLQLYTAAGFNTGNFPCGHLGLSQAPKGEKADILSPGEKFR